MTSDGRFSYSWNDEDRLVSAVPTAVTNGERKVEHVYDWMGRRILRTVSAFDGTGWSAEETTRYVYQDWNVIWETITRPAAALETRWNFWGLDLSGSLQGVGGVGGLLAVQMSPLPLGEGQGEGFAYFANYDGNGNILQYTDGQGTRAAEFDYDPFGKTIVAEGSGVAQLTYRFSTKPECGVFGGNYFGFRYYSCTSSRFLNRDPLAANLFDDSIWRILPPAQDFLQEFANILDESSLDNFERKLYALAENTPISKNDILGLISFPFFDNKKECKVKKEGCMTWRRCPASGQIGHHMAFRCGMSGG
jgi:RHS repeat-associated protein